MFTEGDRVELVTDVDVYGLEHELRLLAGDRLRVVRLYPGRVSLRTAAGLRLTLPARLLRRV